MAAIPVPRSPRSSPGCAGSTWRRPYLLAVACLALLALVPAASASTDDSASGSSDASGGVLDYVEVRAYLDQDAYHAGATARIAVEMRIDSTVHVNAHVPSADYQYPTDITWDETPAGLKLSDITWPKPAMKAFEFTDGEKIAVLEGTPRAQLVATIPANAPAGTLALLGTFKAQGCTHSICYAPQSDSFRVTIRVVAANEPTEKVNENKFEASGVAPATGAPNAPGSPAGGAPAGGTASAEPSPGGAAPGAVATSPSAAPDAEPASSSVASRVGPDGERAFDCPTASGPKLRDRSLLWVFLFAYGSGLALAFTPCVLPLVPITIGFFARQRASGNRPVGPACLYVLGLAIVYSALGTFAALSGRLFGEALQNPYVLIGISAILVALALSNFGLWDLSLPASFTSRIGGGKSGLAGAMMMGGAMGLVAAPCVGPLVVSLLTYVAELGSRLPGLRGASLGGGIFFVLALGLGTPFFLVGLGIGSLRPGEWMVTVKKIFGFVILGVVLWFLRSVIGSLAFEIGVVLLLGAAAVFFLLTARAPSHGTRMRLGLNVLGGAAALATIGSILAFTGLLSGGARIEHEFSPYSAAAVQRARSEGKPVVIDFSAEWCTICKEIEHEVFPDPEVQRLFGGFTLLRADLTQDDDPTVKALRSEYGIRGLPTIVFLGADGKEVRDLRLTGPESPKGFALRLKCATTTEPMVAGG